MTDTGTCEVDPTNVDQAGAWDGAEGAYWADHSDGFERSTSRYNPHLLDATGLDATSRVLDVGCGTGDLTLAAAKLTSAGQALGVDLSARMVELARRWAEAAGAGTVRYEQGDAQIHPFEPGGYDVAISKTGTMFFGDPVAAFGNIATALRPGGRLVMLVWQDAADNEWFREISTALAAGRSMPTPPPDAPGPFSMSDPKRIRHVLGASGFGATTIDEVREPMWFGSDADGAYEFVVGLLGWMLEGLDDAARRSALDSLRAALSAHETTAGVVFDSAAWLVTARRDRTPELGRV